MITLENIKDWLKTKNVATNYYIGRLDTKKEQSLGVYHRTRSGPPIKAIGQDSSYNIKAVTLLLHWNQNAKESEAAANNLWTQLQNVTQLTLGNEFIYYLALQVPEPICVDTDENGVYEYVIDFDLYYRR